MQLVAVVFGLGASVSLLWASQASTARTDVPTVAIVGDSITEQGTSVLTEDLTGGWHLRIDGRSGYTISQQVPAAQSLAAHDPHQVIVNLGTNDVMRADDLDQSAAILRQMVALFPAATCIHLVNINEGIVLGGTSFAALSSQLNQAIAAIAADDPRLDVLDWSAAVRADEAAGHPDDPLLTDTVHPTRRGQHVLAALYADALAACPRPR
jgi:lysophospholipase L1-like esterase